MLLASRASTGSWHRRDGRRVNIGKLAIAGIGLTLLAVLIGFPLASLVQYVAGNGLGVIWDRISSSSAVFALKFTLALALFTALINGVLGTLLAAMLARRHPPWKGIVDALMDLPNWERSQRILELARLAVARRADSSPEALEEAERRVPGLGKRVIWLEMPAVAVSATEIRERVRGGQPIGGLAPAAVEEYIRKQGLYST